MYSVVVSRRLRRIALTAAVLPLVVLFGLRSAWAQYACAVDGRSRSSCCCPKKAAARHEPADGTPRLAASRCCAVTVGETSVPPAVRATDSSRADDVPWPAAVGAAAPAPAVPASIASPHIALARPPPPALPAYLANRTILR